MLFKINLVPSNVFGPDMFADPCDLEGCNHVARMCISVQEIKVLFFCCSGHMVQWLSTRPHACIALNKVADILDTTHDAHGAHDIHAVPPDLEDILDESCENA